MKALSLYVSVVLAVLTLAGCDSRPRKPLLSRGDYVAIKAVASRSHDAELIETLESGSGRMVARDGSVVAAWVPIAPSFLANLANDDKADVVTRTTRTGSEILVLHTANDILETDIESVQTYDTKRTNSEQDLVTLTDAGSQRFFLFTIDHVGRYVVVIVNDEVRAVPRIVSPVRKLIVLSPTTIKKVSVFAQRRNP